MKVLLILPALLEAVAPRFRPLKYSLFPPLGLATLAAYLKPDDQIEILDEHVQPLHLGGSADHADIVAIEVYTSAAKRAYEIADHYRARGSHVCLGGLHVTALPDEASHHADTIFLGPGEDTWPQFLDDLAHHRPQSRYISTRRTLAHAPFAGCMTMEL